MEIYRYNYDNTELVLCSNNPVTCLDYVVNVFPTDISNRKFYCSFWKLSIENSLVKHSKDPMLLRHEIKSYMASISYSSFGKKITDIVSENCSAYVNKSVFFMKHIL